MILWRWRRRGPSWPLYHQRCHDVLGKRRFQISRFLRRVGFGAWHVDHLIDLEYTFVHVGMWDHVSIDPWPCLKPVRFFCGRRPMARCDGALHLLHLGKDCCETTDTMLRCLFGGIQATAFELRVMDFLFFKASILALVHACSCFFGNLGFDLPFFIFLIDRVTYVLLLWGFHFPAAQLLGFAGFLITWWVSVQPSLPAKLVEGPRSHLKLCAAEFDWKDWDLQFWEVIPKDGMCHASSGDLSSQGQWWRGAFALLQRMREAGLRRPKGCGSL